MGAMKSRLGRGHKHEQMQATEAAFVKYVELLRPSLPSKEPQNDVRC